MSLKIEDRQIRPSLRLQYRSSPEQLAVRWGRSLLKSLRGLHPNTVATGFFTSDQARLPKGSISIGIQREKNRESFETSRLNSTGTFSRSEIAHFMSVMDTRTDGKDFTMVAP